MVDKIIGNSDIEKCIKNAGNYFTKGPKYMTVLVEKLDVSTLQ